MPAFSYPNVSIRNPPRIGPTAALIIMSSPTGNTIKSIRNSLGLDTVDMLLFVRFNLYSEPVITLRNQIKSDILVRIIHLSIGYRIGISCPIGALPRRNLRSLE